MERIKVYIDGANFHYGIKTINKKYNDFHFDFKKFCETVTTTKRNLVGVNYYNGSLKQQINPIIFSEQQKFFAYLKNQKINVVICKRQQRTDANNKEHFTIKGDDINLAIDMLADAYENVYDTAILVSGDGDFAPLVLKVKSKGKRVENYHFPDNASYSLLSKCVSIPIDKSLVKRHFLSIK